MRDLSEFFSEAASSKGPDRTKLDRDLILAISKDDVAKVKELIAAGVDIDKLDTSGETALARAAFLGNLSIVRALIAAGADVNKGARAPLGTMSIDMKRTVEMAMPIIKELLAAGADPHAWDIRGNSKMFEVNLELTKLLISAGGDINSKESTGKTPLVHAIIHARQNRLNQKMMDYIEFLISEGADVNIDNGVPILTLTNIWDSRHNDHEKVLDLLKMFLKAGANVDVKGALGRTPLHYAAENGLTSVANELLEAGADPLALDNDGKNPMDLTENKELLDVLRKAVTKQMDKTQHGDIPLLESSGWWNL